MKTFVLCVFLSLSLFAQSDVFFNGKLYHQTRDLTSSPLFLSSPSSPLDLNSLIFPHSPADVNKPAYVPLEFVNSATNNKWRYTYTYNSAGRPLSELYETWGNNAWNYSGRRALTYTLTGLLLMMTYEVWVNSAWQWSGRSTFTHDTYGNPVTILYEIYTSNNWTPSSRYNLSYDVSGNLITQVSERYTNNNWVNYSRSNYTFDANGNELTLLYQVWTNNAWLDNYRRFSTYNSANSILTSTYENYINNAWVSDSRALYTYIDNVNVLTETYEIWNTTWRPQTRYTYSYDANMYLTSSLTEDWSGSAWIQGSRATYINDADGNAIQGDCTLWQGGAWVTGDGMMILFYNDRKDAFQSMGFQATAQYTAISGAEESDPIPGVYSLSQNFPNPFNPKTVIGYQLAVSSNVTLKIYDILGNETATLVSREMSAGSYDVTFDASDLPSGVYFYRLQAGEFVSTKKLILMK